MGNGLSWSPYISFRHYIYDCICSDIHTCRKLLQKTVLENIYHYILGHFHTRTTHYHYVMGMTRSDP